MNREDSDSFFKLRNYVFKRLDTFERSVEEIKTNYNKELQVVTFSGILDLLLVVVHTEKGSKLYFRILEYVKDFEPEFAKKYWNLYEKELEINLKNGII